MHANVYKTLSQHIDQGPAFVDSLIISSFLVYHGLEVPSSGLLAAYAGPADPSDSQYDTLVLFLDVIRAQAADYHLEDLIELFEFVVSPSEKVINGAVYTPQPIREYIVNRLLQDAIVPLDRCTLYDPSCGCGGFLLTFSEAIRARTGRTYQAIYEQQIFGVDIADYSLTRARLLLTLQACLAGETREFEFNLTVANSLSADPRQLFPQAKAADGFDLVAGNPPYVASRNMDAETLALALSWPVSRSGHPDLYIPFFQIGIQALNPGGRLGYITVNTFIKSVNGKALRHYFGKEALSLTIINFGGEQVFAERNTYTCLCFISRGNGGISYLRTSSDEIQRTADLTFQHFKYDELDHAGGWNLVNTAELSQYIQKVETTGRPFRSLYNTKNGIATLMNDVYKFRPARQDEEFYYLEQDGGQRIERGICRDIVNANKIKRPEDIPRINEKIIFPYRRGQDRLEIIPETILQAEFPGAYAYLLTQRSRLATRDRGKRTYETWFAYGRRQSMEIAAYKLFFPHICETPTFVLCDEQELLFYNGIAVVSNDRRELELLQILLSSKVFLNYIKSTTKDYSSGYISLSRNYLKNFGIPQMTEWQKTTLLESAEPEQLIRGLYGLDRN